MEKNKVQYLTRTALITAAYAAVTFAFSWMAYGQVQFRISEILILLIFVDSRYFAGLVIGCLLANLPSPLGVADIVCGTLATALAAKYIITVRKSMGFNNKSLIVASLGPVIANGLVVGAELSLLFGTPFIINAVYVALGEFAVVTIAGTVFMSAFIKNDKLLGKIKMQER